MTINPLCALTYFTYGIEVFVLFFEKVVHLGSQAHANTGKNLSIRLVDKAFEDKLLIIHIRQSNNG